MARRRLLDRPTGGAQWGPTEEAIYGAAEDGAEEGSKPGVSGQLPQGRLPRDFTRQPEDATAWTEGASSVQESRYGGSSAEDEETLDSRTGQEMSAAGPSAHH